MVLRKDLLKVRIREKLRDRIKSKFKTIDFRKLKGHPQRYPAEIPLIHIGGLTPDDAFYISESFLKKTGEIIGKKVYGYTKKESDRQNALLKNVMWLEHKAHRIHSGFEKTIKLMNKFSKVPVIDTPMPQLRKKVWNLIVKGE